MFPGHFARESLMHTIRSDTCPRQLQFAAALLFVWLALAASACPDGSKSHGPTDTCESIGEQCRLGGGQLGVCTADANNELVCEPQH